ncbi:hypothetical protein [Paractinoplanes lichenicola]|uniref:Roadblock/LAMTOR2 domain-containing protein n=1 Tax=Paractinoplanes lichenicola TaxID=2802976 RepID=A0ABS1VSE6_9ACTN|nr:hypothetical protein [Actinoplanes lichenicola]MBL7257279.1 hypothetical protein [Actinoplanes lichenicola]
MPPLTEALGIPGAHAVSLLDPEGPRVLWWAGETAPTEQESAAAVTLAAAAAGLVLLDGNGGDELSDILLTSADAFHVVRVVGTEAPLVAHLTLRRAGANLAMARREFDSMLTAYARDLAPASATPPALGSSLNFDLIPPDLGGGTVDLSDAIRVPDTPEGLLPRRNRLDQHETEDEDSDMLSLLGRPYVTDDSVLDRVLVALRSL